MFASVCRTQMHLILWVVSQNTLVIISRIKDQSSTTLVLTRNIGQKAKGIAKL